MAASSPGPNGAGQTVDVAAPGLYPVSPMEVLTTLLRRTVDPRIILPVNIIGGPATKAQQSDQGCASIIDTGSANITRNAPILFARLQLRILHHDLSQSDRIAYHLRDVAHGRHRELVTLDSGQTWLVHRTNVLAGPSGHFDSQVTWENLMFIACDIGTTPVS